MRSKKSEELLASLSVHEATAFEKYLESPFFNVSKDCSLLYKALSSDPTAEKRVIHKILYPKTEFNDKQLRYIISELNGHLEDFLMLRRVKKEPMTELLLKSKALGDRGCQKAYARNYLDANELILPRDEQYFLKQYELSGQHMKVVLRDSTRKTSPDYSSILINADTFYLLSKIRIACEVFNLSNILTSKAEVHLIDELLKLADTAPYNEVPLIRIYSLIYKMLTTASDDSAFQLAGETLKLNGDTINPAELSDLYQYLKNYCVRKVNSGEVEYVRVLFNLYNDMLSNQSLMRYDYMSQWEFKNMVTISLRLNEFIWCEKFLKRYINHLQPSDRKNALTYNTAYLSFMKNDFHNAIRKLQDVEMNDIFYQLDSRVVILKSYYELGDTDAFFYQAAAFRLFLNRNKSISEIQKTIYRNLLRYLSAMVRAGFSKSKLRIIRTEIVNRKSVADMNWLLRKIDELTGDKSTDTQVT